MLLFSLISCDSFTACVSCILPGDYWLACAMEHVRESTEKFRARWLEQSADEYKDNKKHYTYGYLDNIYLKAVITDVQAKKKAKVVILSQKEHLRIMNRITTGHTTEDEDEEDDEEEEDEAQEPRGRCPFHQVSMH